MHHIVIKYTSRSTLTYSTVAYNISIQYPSLYDPTIFLENTTVEERTDTSIRSPRAPLAKSTP